MGNNRIGMVIFASGGRVRAFPVKETAAIDLQSAIVENVKRGSNVYTDCHRSYVGMRGFTQN